MKYTKVAPDTWQSIQINAGVVCTSFTPSTGAISGIIGSTTGGNSFNANPTFQDFGEDVDNVPPNTMQLKRILYYDPALSMNFVTVNTTLGKKLAAAADIDSDNSNHIIPRHYLSSDDFGDLYLAGDYSDKNGETNGGYCVIHIKNALNLGGFQWQTAKNGKGQFAGDFHGHYDLSNMDDPPFDIYIKAGTAESSNTAGGSGTSDGEGTGTGTGT